MTDIMGEILPQDNPSSSTKVSNISQQQQKELDLFCGVYERLNTANDEINKAYKNNLKLEFADIQELHDKTMQTIRSLNVNGVGTKFVIYLTNGESEKFKTFEEFCKYKATSPNATTNIYFVYSFTIRSPEDGSFETYKVKVRILSRLTAIEEIKEQAPPFINSSYFSSISIPIVSISIEYTDYVKARNFLSMIDEWVRGCTEEKGTVVEKIKVFSELIPFWGRNIILFLYAYFTFNSISSWVFDASSLASYLTIYLMAGYLISVLSFRMLSNAERAIDSYFIISYLKLTKGDDKLIAKYQRQNTKSFLYSAIGVAGAIAIGFATNTLFEVFKPHIFVN